MRWVWGLTVVAACWAPGCAVEVPEPEPEVVEGGSVPEDAPVIDYSDWSANQSGTTAKPAYGKGCRYRFSPESLWELAADGNDDHLTVVGPAADEVSVTFAVVTAGVDTMTAEVVASRVLSGKAYYEAEGEMAFASAPTESWTVVDGAICFSSTLVGSDVDVPGEFSLIAQRESDGEMRTVGGTFTLPADKMSPDSALNISDDAIALDLR
jgi:hypothetical protein